MSDFQNHIDHLDARHRELLALAAQARRQRNPDSRNGAWALALAGVLERLSAAIRSHYPSERNYPAIGAPNAWRTP